MSTFSGTDAYMAQAEARGRLGAALKGATGLLPGRKRTYESIAAELANTIAACEPGHLSPQQDAKIRQLQNDLRVAGSAQSRSRSAQAPKAKPHNCPACRGKGVVPVASLTPAARAIATRTAAPKRKPTTPTERTHRALAAGVFDAEHLRVAPFNVKRDVAARILDTDLAGLPVAAGDAIHGLLRSASTADLNVRHVANWLIGQGTKDYAEVVRKSIVDVHPAWSERDRAAIDTYRAMLEVPGSQGGFGAPVMIDPTVVLGSALDDATLLKYTRTVFTTSDNWKGIASSGGSGFTRPGEGDVSVDGSLAYTQPSITVYTARNFIPYSIEVGQDFPGFADQMTSVLSADYLDILANDLAVGNGTTAPMGIFTRMAATTAGSGASHVAVTSAGTIAGADVRAVYAALPQRMKNDPSCAWLMSATALEQIRALASGSVSGGLSPNDIGEFSDGSTRLFSKPVVLSQYAPAFTGTTSAANYCVVGAFSRFVVAQRVGGYVIESVPLLLDFAGGTGRPTGQRGLAATVRYGADVVGDYGSFRLLSNS